MQKLPICVQAFETIRNDGYLYVDKTRYIHRLIDEGISYFLSRPGQFGKSLLVSTLRCFFQGKAELFEGLWISKQDTLEWKEHPVITIDFNEIPCNTPEKLEQGISLNLRQTAHNYDISLKTEFIETQLLELISELEKQQDAKVVVLADEYDKPVTDHFDKGKERLKTAKANWNILRRFLGVLKGGVVSSMLRFVFVTGVSRIGKISVFSDFNHLNDITMSRQYADMLGYTHKEVEDCFNAHIDQLSKETEHSREEIKVRLAQQYGGYRFSERDIKVYNPLSVLMTFSQMTFKNHWVETGTPAFLVNLLRESGYELPNLENLEIDEQIFSTYEIDNLKPEALLFQTGYLTIKKVDNTLYTFDYPSVEVKNTFLKYIFLSLTPEVRGEERSKFVKLAIYLEKGNFNAFFETMSAIFADFPYPEPQPDKTYFYTLFYLMVSASGMNAQSEILSYQDCINLFVAFPDKIFVMEFKCNQSADAAIKRIREKGYADRYKESGKKLFLVGIDFDTEALNLTDWKVERLFLFH